MYLVLAGNGEQARLWARENNLPPHVNREWRYLFDVQRARGYAPGRVSIIRTGTWYERRDWPVVVNQIAWLEQRPVGEVNQERLEALWQSRQEWPASRLLDYQKRELASLGQSYLSFLNTRPPMGVNTASLDCEAIFQRGVKRLRLACERDIVLPATVQTWITAEFHNAQSGNDPTTSMSAMPYLVVACMNIHDTDDVRLGAVYAQGYLDRVSAWSGEEGERISLADYQGQARPAEGAVLHTPEGWLYAYADGRWQVLSSVTWPGFQELEWVRPGQLAEFANLLQQEHWRDEYRLEEFRSLEQRGWVRFRNRERAGRGSPWVANNLGMNPPWGSFVDEQVRAHIVSDEGSFVEIGRNRPDRNGNVFTGEALDELRRQMEDYAVDTGLSPDDVERAMEAFRNRSVSAVWANEPFEIVPEGREGAGQTMFTEPDENGDIRVRIDSEPD